MVLIFYYSAPEEIKDIHFGKTQASSNFELAETFSIGLAILDAAILESSKSLYNVGTKFDYSKFESKMGRLKSKGYS